MEKIPETGREQERLETKIVLEFIRHGERDKPDPRPDEDIRLNSHGIQASKKKDMT